MVKVKESTNPYGKSGDVAVKQIIDRVLVQNFGSAEEGKFSQKESRTIGEMQDEIMREMAKKSRFIDFRRESCEFKNPQ